MSTAADPATESPSSPPGMAWISGGTFAMGSEDFYPEERPVHRVSVDGFWIDERPVTAADFDKQVSRFPVARAMPDKAGRLRSDARPGSFFRRPGRFFEFESKTRSAGGRRRA